MAERGALFEPEGCGPDNSHHNHRHTLHMVPACLIRCLMILVVPFYHFPPSIDPLNALTIPLKEEKNLVDALKLYDRFSCRSSIYSGN